MLFISAWASALLILRLKQCQGSNGGISKSKIPTLYHLTPTTGVVIHIGEEIRKELKRQERTPAWLAGKINCQRPSVYYIFSQPSINTELLLAISKALNTDFFRLYSDEL